eukprot:381873-Prorocentrum_lima.AAC.1
MPQPSEQLGFKRPRVIPPRPSCVNQNPKNAEMEAASVPQQGSNILEPEKWVRVICGRPVVVRIILECATVNVQKFDRRGGTGFHGAIGDYTH